MNGIEQLKRRMEALAPAPDGGYHNHSKEDEAAITATILDVWPTFEEDNPDLLTDAGVSRLFADPRYKEIERRLFAMKTDQGPVAVNVSGWSLK